MKRRSYTFSRQRDFSYRTSAILEARIGKSTLKYMNVLRSRMGTLFSRLWLKAWKNGLSWL